VRSGRFLLSVFLGAALAGGAMRLGPELLRGRGSDPAGHAASPDGAGTGEAASDGGALARAAARAAGALGREEPAPTAGRTYYRYIDATGSLRFVDSFERVPEAFRASAKPMAMGDGSGDNEAPRLTRAESRAPRRPFSGPARQPVDASPPARRAPASAGVVLYSTSWCGWCRKTMAWLDARGVEYENRDIEKRPAWREELIEKSGSTSVPVVEIGGELVHGFDPGRMGELL
jgi:glutaredoxin